MDPTKDMRIKVGFYGVSPSPADGSIWGTVLGFPGAIVRLIPARIPRAPRSPKSMKCRGTIRKRPCRASHRAEWTSHATASFGPFSPADTSPASTAASAKAR